MFIGQRVERAEHIVQEIDYAHRLDTAADRGESYHVGKENRHAIEALKYS